MIMMGSGATTPKVWGYRPGGSHLGSFLTRQLSLVTTGWAYGSFGIGPLDEPNVHRSWLKCGSGPVVDKTYTLWMLFIYVHCLLMLLSLYVDSKNFKISNCDIFIPPYILLCYLLSCQTHPFPLNIFFQMAVYIIVLRDGVPVGLLMVRDPRIWPFEWETWTYCIIV
jgi:hypothetical protein